MKELGRNCTGLTAVRLWGKGLLETGEVHFQPAALSLWNCSQMFYYEMRGKSWFCVRPSGTEPKIKIYFGTSDIKMDSAKKAGNPKAGRIGSSGKFAVCLGRLRGHFSTIEKHYCVEERSLSSGACKCLFLRS